MVSPTAVCCPAMPTCVCSSNCRGGLQILRERHLHIGPRAEQDQRDPVAMPARDEFLDDALDAVEPRQHRAVRRAKVALVHRAGYIDGKDEIARRDFVGYGIADPLRPRQRRRRSRSRPAPPRSSASCDAAGRRRRVAGSVPWPQPAGRRTAPAPTPAVPGMAATTTRPAPAAAAARTSMARRTQAWCTLIHWRTSSASERTSLPSGGVAPVRARLQAHAPRLRKPLPAIAAVEKRQPGRPGQRRDRLARKGRQRRAPARAAKARRVVRHPRPLPCHAPMRSSSASASRRYRLARQW